MQLPGLRFVFVVLHPRVSAVRRFVQWKFCVIVLSLCCSCCVVLDTLKLVCFEQAQTHLLQIELKEML